jgi:calcium binding protein 39
MPCGVVLRDLLKYQEVAIIIMYDEGDGATFNFQTLDYSKPCSGQGVFWSFFPWIDRGAFEISADAFTTFRVGHLHLVDKCR